MRLHLVQRAALSIALLIVAGSDVHAQALQRPGASSSGEQTSTRRLILVVDAGASMTPGTFTQSFTVPINAEAAPVSAALSVATSAFIAGGLRVQLASRVSVGAVAFFSSGRASATVDAQVPHPFYFDQPRQIGGEASGLRHREVGAHLEIGYSLAVGRRQVRVFAGPTFVRVEQALVTGVEFTDTYPFDTAAFTAPTLAVARRFAPGFNAGAETTWRLGPSSAFAAMVRYSHASVSLSASPGNTAEVSAGGVWAGIGLRRFF